VNQSPGRVISIDGPVISTAELQRQLEIYEGVLGMQRLSDEMLAAPAVAALFGVHDRTARLVSVATPGTRIGAWLVEFLPHPDSVIRVGGVGYASDALKMIDVFTNDLAAAVARIKAHGFEFVSEGADLTLPDGSRFVEAHFRAPDGVMMAAISTLDQPMGQFVAITDRLFSEIQSSSGPVSDFEPVRHFYANVLGVPMGLSYEFESDAFSKMVGTHSTTRIRAHNYGRVVEDVMLGIIHYGLPPGSYASLRERAQPPNRGIIGARLLVAGLDALLARCAAAGVEIARPAAPLDVAATGRARVAAVRGPHGVWHWLVEPAA
jgi:catechol 2,3-dioxygenase-like lactoylglutathione lyase family enzyme